MRVEFDVLPEMTDAAVVMQAFRSIFPTPGAYLVEPAAWRDPYCGCDEHQDAHFAKAAGVETGEGPFESWFLQELERAVNHRFQGAQLAIWDVLDSLLMRHRVVVPSELDYWQLHQTLFDLSHASTAEMAGLHVRPDVAERLAGLGWRPREVLDFPALAYRLGRVWRELEDPSADKGPFSWARLLELAHSHPLTAAEEATVAHLRERAGIWLTPVMDDNGRTWTAAREIAPLRRLTTRAVADRVQTGEAITQLRNSQRAMGVTRDARRVIRTELAEGRARGSWKAGLGSNLGGDQLMYRTVSSNPCRACAELYLMPDGTPRLYTRADLEAMSATVNRGPRQTWTAKIGPTHPNCVCSPWQPFNRAYQRLFDQRASANRDMLQAIGAFEEAA